MCGYQGYEFGAGLYPDSVCIDGRLYDADYCDSEGRIYMPDDRDFPCPVCRPNECIEYWADSNCDDETDPENVREAREQAISLVNDIRKNRGLTAVRETNGDDH